MIAALVPTAENVALGKGANMKTDRAPTDAVGVGEVTEVSVVRSLPTHRTSESSEGQRLLLVLAADCPRFTVIALSTKSSRILGSRSPDPRGQSLAEALWLTTIDEDGIDTAALATSFGRVIRTGKPDALPLRKCYITHSSARSVSEPARWWSILCFPMLGADRLVTHIVLRLEDVSRTAQMQLAHDAWLSAVPVPDAPPVPGSAVIAPARECPARAASPTEPSLPPATSIPRALRASDRSYTGLLLIATADSDRERFRGCFDEHGYRVLWAHSEKEALQLCVQERPDCILLDLSSPDIGGLRTCRALRELPGCADTAIVCLSARRDTAVLDSALLAGADDVLEEPVKPPELLSHVQAALLQQPGMTEAVRSHCQTLRHQRMRLCRLQLQRERIASYIVHDLKEPLSTIDLRAALLLLDTALSEHTRSSVERIRAQVRSALLQVLSLLDIRMLDEGRLETRNEAIDLSRMVRDLLADFDAKAQVRAVTLRSDIEVPQITADPELLRRVLANLLENAIRHAPNNSVVAVTAHRIAGARVELRVVDAGASIPADMMERIFDPFVQLEGSGASSRNRTGRGLGLAFCKLAVEAHHGEIAATTINNRTVFSVKLPDTYKRSVK